MSAFSELFSDFQESIKTYTEKLDVTERMFMRLYTRGMQRFQRETEYIEHEVIIPLHATDYVFYVPNDLLRIIEIQDCCNCTFLLQNYEQYRRNIEYWSECSCPEDGWNGYSGYSGYLGTDSCKTVERRGYLETPTDYGMRLPRNVRLAAQFHREIRIFPYLGDTQIQMKYIPDVHAISQLSSQWAAWYPSDTNFYNMFRNTGVSPSLNAYEQAYLNYAIAEYLKTLGALNQAQVFEQAFWAEVKMAIVNKPQYFRQGVREYHISPYS